MTILIGKAFLFGYFSTSSLLSQWPGLAARELHSRRQPCFFCEIIRVLDRHSWFFPSWPKGAHKRSPKSTKALQPAAIKVLSSASVILGNQNHFWDSPKACSGFSWAAGWSKPTAELLQVRKRLQSCPWPPKGAVTTQLLLWFPGKPSRNPHRTYLVEF